MSIKFPIKYIFVAFSVLLMSQKLTIYEYALAFYIISAVIAY